MASNDIAATHSVVQVASLGPVAAALARCGMPLTSNDLMILRGAYAPPWYRDPMGTASWSKSGQRPPRMPHPALDRRGSKARRGSHGRELPVRGEDDVPAPSRPFGVLSLPRTGL